MSEVVLEVVRLGDIFEEFKELSNEHWEEIALHRDDIPLDPDWNRYRELDDTGFLSVVSAKHEGQLVGYCIFIVMPHLHYQSTVVAMNDVVFLKKEFRNVGNGKRMLAAAEQELVARGVKKIAWHVKEEVLDFTPILIKNNYEFEESVWGKVVKG